MEQLPAQTVDPTVIDWALVRLKPPTESELRLAHRVGLDPNVLLERFSEQYSAACAADAATINQLAEDAETCGPVWRALWDYLNEYATEPQRHHEWWIAPAQNVAKIVNPRATAGDLDGIGRMIRSSGRVGWTLNVAPACATAVRSSSLGRAREHRPTTTRRTASSSSTASADPPDADSERPRRRGTLRHVSFALTAFLREIGLVS